VRTFAELAAALRDLHIGDRVTVDIRRGGQPMRVAVAVTGYTRPRVRIVDAADVIPEQGARRQAWLVGALGEPTPPASSGQRLGGR
jgi:predicted metalloprotease with PDZ domain